jgi:multidrug efflux system membrane fusion protein
MRATLSADQAQIDLAQLQLDFTSIRAPIDGRLGARLVDAGNVVHANDPNGIVIMSQIQPIFVTFSIPQNALDILRHQQSHRALRVLAMNQDGSEVLDDGKLTLIESQIDTATGTVRCKATFKNANEKLWPGAFVSVEIVLNELPDVVLVPTIAIQAGAQHPFVYVVTPKNVVETRQVAVGPASGDQTVILTGLAEGEHVVVEGQFQIGDGSRVDVKGALIAEPLRQSNEGRS